MENLKTETENSRVANVLKYLIPGIFCLVYLILAIGTAPHYGISWDQAEEDWYNAERNLNYFLTFDSRELDFDTPPANPLPEGHPTLYSHYKHWEILYFGNFLSAVGCRVFFQSLGWIGAVEAHHLPNFLLVAGVLAAMFFLMRNRFGMIAASITLFAIAFQPRFWADTHFNTKDLPYACMMAFTLLAARRGLLNRSARWVIVASVLLGLSAVTKLNAISIPVILAVWYLLSLKEIEKNRETQKATDNKLFIIALAISPLIVCASFLVVWPYMWFDTITKMNSFLSHYFSLARAGKEGLQWDTLYLFISVQPPAILIFGGIGIGVALSNVIRRKNGEISAFLLTWFSLPVLRMLTPKMLNFDGVRHFIEYAVPLGALAGLGAAGAATWLSGKARKFIARPAYIAPLLVGALISMPFITWFITMARIHPYEIAYFNFMIGGTRGAQTRWKDATDYWGSSYRQGMRWLNDNAEQSALVIVPINGYSAASTKNLFLRGDLILTIMENKDQGTETELDENLRQKQPLAVYIMYITKSDEYSDLIRQIDSSWVPAHVIEVDGAPILKIMKKIIEPRQPDLAPRQ